MAVTVTHISKKELGENQAFFTGSIFMQTIFWAELKEEYGFKPYFFTLSDQEYKEGLVVLERPIAKGFSIAYIPHGPSVRLSTTPDLLVISKELKKYLPKKCILIRYDLLSGTTGKEFPKKLGRGLNKSTVGIQVPDTTILDISRTEDNILKAMHKKTRYNIKLASKKGVIVREADISELDNWYNMYEVTAKRDSIAIHSKAYYLSVYNRAKLGTNIDMKLLFAEHEGELLAGIFVLISGDSATYLYGASSNIKRNLMPAYLLQWEAIRLVKGLGATSYDFFGIPPVNDKNHSMYGLYQFKIRFGGDIIHRDGCYDFFLSPLAPIFTLIERSRNFYYKRIKH